MRRVYTERRYATPNTHSKRNTHLTDLPNPGQEFQCHNTKHVSQGKEGVVIVKTKQTLLITHYPETIQPGQAATTVEKLGDYLVGTGY